MKKPRTTKATKEDAIRLVRRWRERLIEIELEADALRRNIAGVEAQFAGKLLAPNPSRRDWGVNEKTQRRLH